MLHVDRSDPTWYAALSLRERFATLRAAAPAAATTDRELGQRRLQRWLAASPLSSVAALQRRLAADGLTLAEFVHLLGEPLTAVRDRGGETPWWLERLARAFAAGDATALQSPLPSTLDVVAPLVGAAFARLQDGVQALRVEHDELPFDADAVDRDLLADLYARLDALVQPVVSERAGATPALLHEFPLLARRAVECCEQWLSFSLELLTRFCADRQAIRQTFCQQDPGLLSGLAGGAGDYHRGGKTVLILRFSGGLKLVYKPRSLALDTHFQQLLVWLNDAGATPAFRTLQVLDRGAYGWCAFVQAGGCVSREQVQRFYRRMGGYLALLHALAGADMHDDNLIAAGEQPVLVDLETLFQPAVGEPAANTADATARAWLASSVLPIGLLPLPLWQSATDAGVDISAIGGHAANRPTLRGHSVDPAAYRDDVIAGFAGMYDLLQHKRPQLLAADGPLARFANDETRLLLRPTEAYVALLDHGARGSVQRDAIYRDCLFDWLWWAVDEHPHLARTIVAEQRHLRQGDIPLFTTSPVSRDLWASDGSRIAAFLREPALDRVRERLTGLNPDDRARQEWAIRASFTALPESARRPASRPPAAVASRTPDRTELIAAARAIGDRLEALALRGADDATWIVLESPGGRPPSVLPAGSDLYGGLPGIALFLAQLGALSGEERYSWLARAALRALRRQIERQGSTLACIGVFAGRSGIIYALTQLAALWREPALLAEAQALLPDLAAHIEQDDRFDLADGAAGGALALLGLDQQTSDAAVRAAAITCGEHLLTHAQPHAAGIAWRPAGTAHDDPPAGMLHGAAGIACALLRLAEGLGERRFRTAALQSLAYASAAAPSPERAPRRGAERQSRQSSWCTGAAGIALARLQALPNADAAMRAEIGVAVENALPDGFGNDQSLCHGDFGTIELLLAASDALGRPQWRTRALHRTASVLRRVAADGWQCGTPRAVEAPGLMTGLAGIGYGLLRVAEPARVPSLLTLAPPADGC